MVLLESLKQKLAEAEEVELPAIVETIINTTLTRIRSLEAQLLSENHVFPAYDYPLSNTHEAISSLLCGLCILLEEYQIEIDGLAVQELTVRAAVHDKAVQEIRSVSGWH